jgi:hypothetical protein
MRTKYLLVAAFRMGFIILILISNTGDVLTDAYIRNVHNAP